MNSTNQKLVRISASLFGLSEDLPALFALDPATLTDAARARIPALDSDHLFAEETYRTLALWWTLAGSEPLYISGPSGSGKTSGAMQFCARLSRPVVTVTARARMDRRELIGHWSVKGGETQWIDGPAAVAWRNGWTLVINEFSAAPADMWVSCNDILEGADLDVGETGEIIPRHPETRVIVTDNTRGHSTEIDEGFFGRSVQDRSVIDRFWHMRLTGLSEKDEAELLYRTADAGLRSRFDARTVRRFCEMLAKAGADSRSAEETQSLGFDTRAVGVSHRALRRMRDMTLVAAADSSVPVTGLFLRIARTAFTEALDSAARESAETILVTAVGKLVESLRASYEKRTGKGGLAA